MHPVLVESTVWVAGRFDLMVTTFVLLGLNCALFFKGVWSEIFVGLMFLFAALSKEMAMMFPVMLFGIICIQSGAGRSWFSVLRENQRLFLIVMLFGCFYLGLRYSVHPGMLHVNSSMVTALSLSERVALTGHAIAFYIHMLIWPFSDLGPMHPLMMREVSGFSGVGGWVCFAAVLLLGIYCVCFRRVFLIAPLLFFASLFPVLHVIPLSIADNVGHERFMALPLVFAVLSLMQFVEFFKAKPAMKFLSTGMGFIFGLWLVFAFFNTSIYLPVWNNNLSLWSWAYFQNPESKTSKSMYMMAALNARSPQLVDSLLDAYSDDQASGEILAIKGFREVVHGRGEKAIPLLEKALSTVYDPRREMVSQGVDIDGLSISMKSAPNIWILSTSYILLAEAYLQDRQYTKVLENVDAFRFYRPDFSVSYLFESLALYGDGRLNAADEAYRNAVALSADGGAHSAVTRSSYFKKFCTEEPALEICGRKF